MLSKNQDTDDDEFTMRMCRRQRGLLVKVTIGVLMIGTLFLLGYVSLTDRFTSFLQGMDWIRYDEAGIVPATLLGLVYSMEDFRNEAGVVPPYWGCENNACNISSVWGPCYAPNERIDWESQVQDNQERKPSYWHKQQRIQNSGDVAGYCRPGFLIIGAGKCGTSSLYHYITEHPRVLPASEKQIHYFKYYTNYPLRWYYNHFPSATSFLSAGALMTGEASPGYLPYPDVAHRIGHLMPGPRILMVGRNPLERSYSSYRYNYENPLIDDLQEGRVKKIPSNQSRDFYRKYLFSYEDMMRAELKQLRKCLAPNGTAVVHAREHWMQFPFAESAYKRREGLGVPPLVDLDGFCYGTANGSVPREQWTELMKKYPEKIMPTRDLHLTQSLIGRSLYLLPLEWWYEVFPSKDIYFICTEELSDLSGEAMSKVAEFLGLPRYNFSNIVQGGPYNVDGHRGYDNEISWDEMKEERASQPPELPDDLRREIVDFIKPYTERLFELVGKRCDW